MINNLKFGLKSLRYAYGIKSNLLVMLIFLTLSMILYVFESNTSMNFYGDFMLMCMSMLPAQLIFSLSASNMILASPLRKRLQTSIPATVTCISMMLIYLFMAAYRLAKTLGNPQLAGAMSGELLMLAVGMVFFMLYLGVVYKYFVVSVLLVLFMVLVFPYLRGWEDLPFHVALLEKNIGGVLLTTLLGMGIVAAGGFLQYLASLLVYRAPMSKMAQSAPLRREL